MYLRQQAIQEMSVSHHLASSRPHSFNSMAEKRRAVEEMFFRHLSIIDELKQRLHTTQAAREQANHREEDLQRRLSVMQAAVAGAQEQEVRLRGLEYQHADMTAECDRLRSMNASLSLQLEAATRRISDLSEQCADALRDCAALAKEKNEQQGAALELKRVVAQLQQQNADDSNKFAAWQQRDEAQSDVQRRRIAALENENDSLRSSLAAVSAELEHLKSSASLQLQPAYRTSNTHPGTSSNSTSHRGGAALYCVTPNIQTMSTFAVVERQDDIDNTRLNTHHHPPPQSNAGGEAVAASNSFVVAESVVLSQQSDDAVNSPMPAPALSEQRTARAPPPPTRRPSARLPSPVVPKRSQLPTSASFSASTPSVPPRAVSRSRTSADLSSVAGSPNSSTQLQKFNFAKVSKLEYVGCNSSPGYVALVDLRFQVHLVAKTSASSSPQKGQQNSGVEPVKRRLATPAQPIKMLGQSWYVFEIFDHGYTLPQETTSGSLEPLPSHLQYRLNNAQYMRLSHILALFIDICSSLKQLHDNNAPHGNLDMWAVFVPRIGASESCASVQEGQSIVLSGFGASPFHRNPIYRAPEAQGGSDDASTAADIWALGVIFWEITNYGVVPPYEHEPQSSSTAEDEQLFDKVKRNEVALSCPEQCPAVVYDSIIAPCLSRQSSSRPTVDTLLDSLCLLVDQSRSS